jgi:hypothetical protein
MPPFVRFPRAFLALEISRAVENDGMDLTLPRGYVDHASARNRWTHPLLPDLTVARCTYRGDDTEVPAVYSLRSGSGQYYVTVVLP